MLVFLCLLLLWVCLFILQLIANKIKRCKTDSFPGLEFDNYERPECNNLLSIYQLSSGKTKEEVVQECQNMNWGTFKTLLTDALIDHLHPIQVSPTKCYHLQDFVTCNNDGLVCVRIYIFFLYLFTAGIHLILQASELIIFWLIHQQTSPFTLFICLDFDYMRITFVWIVLSL